VDLSLEFSRESLPIEKYSVYGDGLRTDLALRAFLELGKDLEMEYDPEGQGSFVLRALRVRYQVAEGRRTGRIMSTLDLSGSRMFVTIQNRLAQIDSADAVQSNMTLESLSIFFSGAPDLPLTLSGQDLKRSTDSQGGVFYYYDIPVATSDSKQDM
jgi:hypothetical protein